MTPSERIRLQALKLKERNHGHNPGLMDRVLDDPINKEELKKEYRNVCALIHVSQFNALETLCELLEMSKREVMNMALDEFLIQARCIMEEVAPFEHMDEIEATRGGN